MRTIIKSLLAVLAISLAACTHNNGYIGNWFGTWHVTEITVNGEKDSSYTGNLFFKFQTDIADLINVLPHNDYHHRYCHWEEQQNGKVILIDFSYDGPDWDPDSFNPPAESMLDDGPNLLEVSKNGKRKVRLTLHKPDQTIVYTLKKE